MRGCRWRRVEPLARAYLGNSLHLLSAPPLPNAWLLKVDCLPWLGGRRCRQTLCPSAPLQD